MMQLCSSSSSQAPADGSTWQLAAQQGAQQLALQPPLQPPPVQRLAGQQPARAARALRELSQQQWAAPRLLSRTTL